MSTESLMFSIDSDVLLLTVSGISIHSISNMLYLPIKDVEEIIWKWFGVSGWNHDLDFSPLKEHKSNIHEFLLDLTSEEEYGTIEASYEMVEKYLTLRKEYLDE